MECRLDYKVFYGTEKQMGCRKFDTFEDAYLFMKDLPESADYYSFIFRAGNIQMMSGGKRIGTKEIVKKKKIVGFE